VEAAISKKYTTKYINAVAWHLFSEYTLEDGFYRLRIYWRKYNALGKKEYIEVYSGEYKTIDEVEDRIAKQVRKATIEGPKLNRN